MRSHDGDATIQTKGGRALSSGILWPEDIQTKSGYDARRSMKLTQAASAGHKENQELQVAALEALAKYVEKQVLAKELAMDGGEQLIEEIMKQHSDVSKVRSFGNLVLGGLKRVASVA